MAGEFSPNTDDKAMGHASMERTASNKLVRKLTVYEGDTGEQITALVDATDNGFVYFDAQIAEKVDGQNG